MFRDNITPCGDRRDCYYRVHYPGGFTGCNILNPERDKDGNNLPPYPEGTFCKFRKPADWKEEK